MILKSRLFQFQDSMIRNPTKFHCLIVAIFLFPAGVIFGQNPVPLKVSDAFLTVNAAEVKVGGEIGRRIGITEHANLESLHLDRYFIQPFQQKKEKGRLCRYRHVDRRGC